MATGLDAIYAQLLGQVPAGDTVLDDPAFSPAPPLPDWANTMMGMPFAPAMTAEPVPESAQVDPMLGVTPAFGATTTAQDIYGYSPQPRPPLPAPVAEDAAGLYGPFRGVWEQMQAEPDPLAALMAGPMEEEPMDPRVPALPWEPTRAFGQAPYQTQGRQPSQSERTMAGRHPRVMERVNWLRGLRAQRGY